MRAGVQGLVNEVIGYGMGAAVNRSLGIVVACIYPILLNRDEYGRLDVIFSVPALLSVVFLLGFDSTLARFFYEHEDVAQRRRLVSTAFYTAISFTLLSVGILLLLSKPLALWLYGEPQYVLYLRLVLAAMPFVLAHHLQIVLFRLDRRVHTFNLITAGLLILSALIGILSILIFKVGVAGVLIGYIVGHIATSAIGIFINRRHLSLAPALNRLPELLGFGLPLVASGTAFWFIGYVNRPILAHRVSADDLGLFAIASGGVNVMALLIGAFRNAWQPFAFSIIGREDSGNVYGRTLTLFTFIGTTIAVCGSLFASQALLIINAYTHKNWSGAAASVGPLAMGTLFSAMYFVVQTGIYIARRTSVIAWTMALAAVVSIVCNLALIPRFGILGAAFATAIGQLTALLALYIVAQRIAPIPYQPGKLITTVLAAVAVIVLAFQLPTDSLMRELLYKFALLFAYFAALRATRVITFRDLVLFWNGIRSALGSVSNHFRANR
jgi:O-antigen/teichoic acid export membrane protein